MHDTAGIIKPRLQTCQLSRIFRESHEIVLPRTVSLLRLWNSRKLAIVNSGRWLAINMGLRLALYGLGMRPYHFLSCTYKLYSCTCKLNASKLSTCMSLGLDWWSPHNGRSIHWHPSRWGYFFSLSIVTLMSLIVMWKIVMYCNSENYSYHHIAHLTDFSFRSV